jgi:hypothetical protein
MPETFCNEEERIFTIDNSLIPSVTGVLAEEGFVDVQWFTQEGAENGTRRHTIAYLHAIDDLVEDSIDDTDKAYLDAFIDLLAVTGAIPIPELMEKRRFNLTYRYCGRPDLPVIYQGRKEIIDLKMTSNVQGWHRLQIGGYIGLYDDIFHGRCAYLQSNGKFKLSKDVYGRKDREDFLCILRTNQLRRNL